MGTIGSKFMNSCILHSHLPQISHQHHSEAIPAGKLNGAPPCVTNCQPLEPKSVLSAPVSERKPFLTQRKEQLTILGKFHYLTVVSSLRAIHCPLCPDIIA